MAISRIALIAVVIIALAGRSAVAGDGSPAKPIRTDSGRIRQLVQIALTEPDEQKRRAAILELGRADPRHSTDVIHAVSQALLKDSSSAVRLTAVQVIVEFRSVFSVAGLALESAVDTDASAIVRSAAKQALWDYHLMGYKSARARERLLAQTPEPPRARPGQSPVPLTAEPPVRTAVAQLPPPMVPLLPISAGILPGPRVIPQPPGPVAMLTSLPPVFYQTAEPPISHFPGTNATTFHTPAMMEPPILPPSPMPLPTAFATPPPPGLYLPPIVSDLSPVPSVVPDQRSGRKK